MKEVTEPRWVPVECDGPLFSMPPLELCQLWGELVEAYHGKNGFGGHTAELYAYRFQQYVPTIHAAAANPTEEQKWEHYFEAGRRLLSLLQKFYSAYPCSVSIDGIDAEEWAEAIACQNHTFDHRAHVEILPHD